MILLNKNRMRVLGITTTTTTTIAPVELTFTFVNRGSIAGFDLPDDCNRPSGTYVSIVPTGSTYLDQTGGTMGYFYFESGIGEWFPDDESCRNASLSYEMVGETYDPDTARFIWEASTTPNFYGNTKTSSQWPYDRFNSGYYYIDYLFPW